MDVHEIAGAPVDLAHDAARQWSEGGDLLRQTASDLRTLGAFETWSGHSAESMRHRVDSSANRTDAASLTASGTSTALQGQALAVSTAQAAVVPTLATVKAAGMRVSPDGTVVAGGAGGVAGVLAAGATVALKAAVTLVRTLDSAAATVIQGLCAVDTPPSPSPVMIDPASAAVLIADRTDARADAVIPEAIGRAMTATEQGKIRQAVAEARTQLALRGLSPDEVAVSVQNLNGTPVVVAGDLSSADTVTTMVSGVDSSEVGKIVGTSSAAGRIAGPGHAVIAWHGYQAPAGYVGGASPSNAQHGVSSLRGLQSSLRESTRDDAELRILAHSYGSTLLGAAASEPTAPLEADVVHLVGSPGTGHGHAGDLHLRAKDGDTAEIHAWRAPGDVIRLADGIDAIHGASPAAPDFGADTIDGASPALQGGRAGGVVDTLTDAYLWTRGEWNAHSGYWSDEQFLDKVR
ncbi:MAG: alpha/beta hydrolase [Mycobacteriaceae bacterium]|uniref:alpha/beta hydrolase n=1 Tax=Corynebacterium sp. TaxID=1720 RepID=UPI003F9AE413